MITPAAFDEVNNPLSVNVPPLILAVTLLSDATVMLGPIVVLPPPVVVIVTAPPFKLRVAAPAAEVVNVRSCPAVGVMVTVPPEAPRVADEPLGLMIFNALAPPPEVTDTELAVIAESAPRFTVGLAN